MVTPFRIHNLEREREKNETELITNSLLPRRSRTFERSARESVDEMRATIRTDVVGIESVPVQAGTAGVIAALTRAIPEMLRVLHWQIVTVGVMPLMHRHRR